MAPAPYPSATAIDVDMPDVSSEPLTRGVVQEKSLFRSSSEKEEFRSENCHDKEGSSSPLWSTGVPPPAGEGSPAASASLADLTNPRRTPSMEVSWVGGKQRRYERRLYEDGVSASHGAVHELSEENSRDVAALLEEESVEAREPALAEELVDHGGS